MFLIYCVAILFLSIAFQTKTIKSLIKVSVNLRLSFSHFH